MTQKQILILVLVPFCLFTCLTLSFRKIADAHAADDTVWFFNELEKMNESLKTDPQASLQRAQKLLAYAIENPEAPHLRAQAYERIGISYYYLNQLDLSNKYNYEALLLYDSLNDEQNLALVLNNIAWNYRVQQKNDLAILYFERSLALFEKSGDEARIQGVLNNLGTAYRRAPDMKAKAMEVFRKSLSLNTRSGNVQGQAYNLNNLGLIHLDAGSYDSAIYFFDLAAGINQQLNDVEEQCRNFLNKAITFSYMQQHDSATILFARARTILDANDFPKTEYVYWGYLYDYRYSTGNYKDAIESLQRKNAYEWEQHEIEYEKKIAELEVKYNVAVKNQELSEARRKLRQTETGALFVLLLSIILVLIKVYYDKTKWLNKTKILYSQISDKVNMLKDLNEENEKIKDNLKKLVKQETDRVVQQNERLRRYAFINAHLIRGPLARIMGLIHVISMEHKEFKDHIAFNKLYESSNELDTVIRKISEVLNDDGKQG